jgi:hypothetical protein
MVDAHRGESHEIMDKQDGQALASPAEIPLYE